MRKIICLLLVCVLAVSLFCGCEYGTEVSNVNYNLNAAANNSSHELVVTCKTGEDEYKKNYVYLNDYVLYVVEDITGTVTDPYHYKVHFYTALPDVDINK